MIYSTRNVFKANIIRVDPKHLRALDLESESNNMNYSSLTD